MQTREGNGAPCVSFPCLLRGRARGVGSAGPTSTQKVLESLFQNALARAAHCADGGLGAASAGAGPWA